MNACKHCGKIIKINRSRDKNKQFCDRACSSKFLFLLPSHPCPICKKPTPSAKKQIYCSKPCAQASKRSQYWKTCEQCGTSFLLKNKAYERRGNGKFCSTSCSRRKYKINEEFFDSLTSLSAYWLGFLYADGYQNSAELIVHLSKKDHYHLLMLKNDMNSEHPIVERNGIWLRVGSKKLCLALNTLGCVQAKSLIVKFPLLDDVLLPHFIRGVFDGDGCAYINKKGYIRCTIYSGSTDFANDLQTCLGKFGIKAYLRQQGNGWVIDIATSSMDKFAKLLYACDVRSLSRKKIKITSWLVKKETNRHHV